MTALLCVLVIVGFCAWLTTKTLPVLEAKWRRADTAAQDRLAIDRRYVTVDERRISLEEHQAEKPTAKTPMPPDLVARIGNWEDEWAREDERKAIEQLYADLGDWDAVRRAYSPSLADTHSDLGIGS